jgi:hypothetical protein
MLTLASGDNSFDNKHNALSKHRRSQRGRMARSLKAWHKQFWL